VLANEDSQIVARVLAGETSEYRRLVERYQQPVFRFAYNMIGDRHDAEDITQEVFVACFDKLRSYQPQRSSVLTWLLTIARNRCINQWKRNRPVTIGEPIVLVDAQCPTSDALKREFWEELDAALVALPLEQRAVFILAEIEQLAYSEIAKIENATLGTVKSRLHRAKQRLRGLLKSHVRET